jgi:aspartate/tyrosine/aromatic aminotransferase
LPFFDFAYHGFGTGLEEDAAAVRHFYAQGHEMLISYSCSKNFGLYGERLGMLAIVTKEHNTSNVSSHIKSIIRTDYSNPPIHGRRLVAEVLQSSALFADWSQELSEIRKRCQKMRQKLATALEGARRDFSYVAQQKGLFSLLSLSRDEVALLRAKYGIVLLENGRINIAALTDDNLAYAASSILKLVEESCNI